MKTSRTESKGKFRYINLIFIMMFVVISISSKSAVKEITNLIPFEKNGQWGYVDDKGTELIKAIYIEAKGFKEELAVIKDFSEKTLSFEYGVINKKGEMVVKLKYDYISDFSDGRAVIKENNKYGLINSLGNIVVKPLFDKIIDSSENLYVFKLDNKYGYMNKNGNILIKPIYEEAYSFLNGLAKVKINGETKFIDKEGSIIPDKNSEIKGTNFPIQDLANLKQDALFYLDKNKASQSYMTEEYSKIADNYYNKMYFMPWHKSPTFSKQNFSNLLASYEKNPGYGENKRPHSDKWIKNVINNADETSFPNMIKKGILLRNSDIRLLPTKEPVFNNFDLAGEGYPFDMIQNSSIPVNTPILITHKSKDGAWYFVETPFCEGWISEENLAFADENFTKVWENGKYRVITEENTAFYDEKGFFKFNANIGALFPENGNQEVLMAVEGDSKNAKLGSFKLSFDVSASKPLKASGENISLIINKLIDKPYGWGGLLGNRDCSSTMKDLFAVFGIWLPRNSAEQAKNGIFISLKNLTPEEKEKMIIDNGSPYITLIWLKGHIMLYIGNQNNKVIAFHNMWGIRIKDTYGNEGRKIVGASVITTLEPGKELAESVSTILERIEGITLLAPPLKIQNILK